jgi:ATP-dependent RNA helicase DeaD
MVERINPKIRKVQGLVLVPTRELAIQVAKHIRFFANHMKLRVLAVYGGEPIHRQIKELSRGTHIVVGTPGRTIDLLADRMLDMGFIEDIDHILSRTPSNRQTSLFSATIDKNVIKICNRYMKNPEKILVSKDEIALTQMKQFYMLVNPYNKFKVLLDILEKNQIDRAIIFCKTRRGTSKLSDKLKRVGYNVKALHAGFTQSQRNRVITDFREGKLDLLTATDVASRGLDIQGITHIINYDVPMEAPVYFHRIGRTARMGQDGTAITLVGYGEISGFNNIKALTKTSIEEITDLPTIQTLF